MGTWPARSPPRWRARCALAVPLAARPPARLPLARALPLLPLHLRQARLLRVVAMCGHCCPRHARIDLPHAAYMARCPTRARCARPPQDAPMQRARSLQASGKPSGKAHGLPPAPLPPHPHATCRTRDAPAAAGPHAAAAPKYPVILYKDTEPLQNVQNYWRSGAGDMLEVRLLHTLVAAHWWLGCGRQPVAGGQAVARDHVRTRPPNRGHPPRCSSPRTT